MPKKPDADERRELQREAHWPDSGDRVWRGSKKEGEKGYFGAPRSLPLLLRLMSEKGIVGTFDCSSVYIDLLSRQWGQGFVEIQSEAEHAYCSGYEGKRGVRTWRERVRALANAGFLELKGKPYQEVGYVLLVHPHIAVERLRADQKLPDGWWEAYCRLQEACGATRPMVKPNVGPKLRVVPGRGGGRRRVRNSAKA